MVYLGVRASRLLLGRAGGAACALFALAFLPSSGVAQGGVVSGTVVDSKTGRPLADATVIVVNGQASARTGARGDFRITNASGAACRTRSGECANLRVTRIGYQASVIEAAIGGAPVRVELAELVVKLDELVVTGTAGEQQKRTLGNAVGRVGVQDIVQVAPPSKLQDMLSVNVPGVRIMRASGAIGTGGTTRIRGSGSLSLSNEPLIYIDGVRS